MKRKWRLNRINNVRRLRDEIKLEKNVGRKKHLLFEIPGVVKYSYFNCAEVEMSTGHEFTSFAFWEGDAIDELVDMIYFNFIRNY